MAKKKKHKIKRKKPREKPEKHSKKTKHNKIKDYYVKEYKKLLLIPIALFILASLLLLFNFIKTGELMKRDVTLKGGISLTVNIEADITEFDYLTEKLPGASLNLRTLESGGKVIAIIIEASDVDENSLLEVVQEKYPDAEYSLETMGSSLGQSFFQQMFKALIVTFLFMGAVFFFYFSDVGYIKWLVLLLSVVSFLFLFSSNHLIFWITTLIILVITIFIYIKYNLPTLAALVSAFLDIYITLAVMELIGMRLTAGGIAAYLMLIGYSIDTSILLSTKLLKETTDLVTALFRAMKTGLTMSAAGIAATGISFLLTNNLILKQIMLILVVGLIIDLITTWIGNVSLLRIYLENVKT